MGSDLLPRGEKTDPDGGRPLDVMAKACNRLKQMCVLTAEVASEQNPELVELSRLVAVLRRDWALQLADEQEDILPILQLRKRPGDELSAAFREVRANHAMIRPQLEHCAAELERLRQGDLTALATSGIADATVTVVASLHRHLCMTTAIILPIARLRLTEADVAALRDGLLARRGPRTLDAPASL